jgi:RimJ/RimL family protein N-acetyltransferase
VEKLVELRPVAESDLTIIYRLTNDPDATGEYEWFGWQDRWSYARRWEQNGPLDGDGGILMVQRSEEVLGFVSWSKRVTARTSFCWNMGIAVLPQARGHGYGTDAQRQLVRYLFAHTPVNRIEAGTNVDNVAEQRALEKAGFTREGVIRGGAFQGGRWQDGVLYSVLRAEVDSLLQQSAGSGLSCHKTASVPKEHRYVAGKGRTGACGT